MICHQQSIFDSAVPLHRHATATEELSAEKLTRTVKGLRLDILRIVTDAGVDGVTGAEVCRLFPERPESTIRTRLTELHRDFRLVQRTERTRENQRGNHEAVYTAQTQV